MLTPPYTPRWNGKIERLEIRIEPGGSVFINGMADKAALAAVRRAAKVAGEAG